ncbi:hypothetical protein [Bythopirellula goksoeyrii]|nr:hypothetical protein [Bythopirellula goksoeyrii]
MRANDENLIDVPEVTLRIPGSWSGPEEFAERLPRGCDLTSDRLVLADGSSYELNALPADQEFAGVFASSCTKLPSETERKAIEDYKVNVCVTGRGGSIAAATELMAAGAAVIAAGGAGVFVDNSGIAHGASDWLTLRESADSGGVYWAFVSTVRANEELYSVGMHILGFREAIIPLTGNDEFDYRTLHSFLGYTAFSGNTLHEGEVVGDPVLPTFIVHSEPYDRFPEHAPMYNPYGQWRLTPFNSELN